jgi:cytidylate kinase
MLFFNHIPGIFQSHPGDFSITSRGKEAPMKTISQIVEEQIHRWQILRQEQKDEKPAVSIVTISRDPGSGGRIIAKRLAEKLGFDVFHRKVLHQMAESADVSEHLLNTLDEKGLSTLEDWISSLVWERHLWPDEYLHHLMKVISTIGEHGRAVIIGRGANFILPTDRQFRARITAPQKMRITHVASDFNISKDEKMRPDDVSSARNRTAGHLSANILTPTLQIPRIMTSSSIREP